MAKRSSRTAVRIISGFGNQLFQLAFGLAVVGDETLYLSSEFGSVRCSIDGQPEIYSLILPPQVAPLRRLSFVRSLSGRFLSSFKRLQLQPYVTPERQKSWKFRIYIHVVQLILSVCFGRHTRLEIANDLGFYEVKRQAGSVFYSGYFQSYHWALDPKVFPKLMTIRPKVQSKELLELIEASQDERPLVVGVRLGDYKRIPKFGVLSPAYYRAAIETALATGKFNRVWIFSDEIELTPTLLPLDLLDNPRWVPMIDSSPAQTFEALRYGHGYVIANSSFSWWGAVLSYAENPLVIAPEPWFRTTAEPIDLIPPNWVRIKGH